jgi:hypothetical protein
VMTVNGCLSEGLEVSRDLYRSKLLSSVETNNAHIQTEKPIGVLPLQLLNPVFLSPGLNKPGVFTVCTSTTGFQVNRFGDRWRYHGYRGYMRSRSPMSDYQRR